MKIRTVLLAAATNFLFISISIADPGAEETCDISFFLNQAEIRKTDDGSEVIYNKGCNGFESILTSSKIQTAPNEFSTDGRIPDNDDSNDLITKSTIFGTDDRVPVTTTKYPWRTLGYLQNLGCTGTLIYRDLVLTAAHCVVDERTGRIRQGMSYFIPHLVRGRSVHRAWINYVWWGTSRPNSDRRSDWAILHLEEYLGDKEGWLGIKSTTAETFPNFITVAGFSGDFWYGATAGAHINCQTRRRDIATGLILNDCDTTRGSSGGPVLSMINGKMTIIGLNVAERRGGNSNSQHWRYYEDQYASVAISSSEFLNTILRVIEEEHGR